ncbi:MAG: hypothetical protein JF601_02525, partial [Acidobacteria bacterium]|nr:hypothetical protein [Acidobacteriota bacterium]
MTYLFTRTAAQGLQAFVPVAVLILWLRHSGRRSLLTAAAAGIAAAIPATIAGGALFARAQQQARWEAALAAITFSLAVAFAAVVFTDRHAAAQRADAASSRLAWITVAVATTIAITRQTMEIFTVLSATGFDLRPEGPAVMTLAGVLAAIVISVACVVIGSRLDGRLTRVAIRTFAIGFALQVGFYGLHEAAEAHLLPASAELHAATEPYGPDSEFGQRLNYVLLLIAAAAAALAWMQQRFSRVLVTAMAPAALALSIVPMVAFRT